MPGVRQVIDLGKRTNPRSPRFLIALIRSEEVRTAIEGYLTEVGTELERTDPAGWFQWLDEGRTVFHARCADPLGDHDLDDGYQPFNYYVRAKIVSSIHKRRAIGEDFYHESVLLPKSEGERWT